MNIPVLLIGKAYDGPVATPVAPDSILEAYELYGGYVYENHTIGATDTSITTTYTPTGSITFLEWQDADLKVFANISGVGVTGTTVGFERLGVDKSLVVKYARTMSASDSEVYRGFSEAYQTTGITPYLYRVGGTPASASITSGGVGIVLTTTGAGSLYNGASATVSSSGITLKQPAGKGEDYVFSTANKTVDDIAEEINVYCVKGYGCILCESIGSGSFAASSMTYTFSGGTDGDFTAQEIADTLDYLDLNGISAVSILGLNYSATGSNTVIDSIITQDLLDEQTSPVTFVQGVPAVSGYTEDAYITALANMKPFYRSGLILAAGECLYDNGIHPPYYSSIAPAIAASVQAADDTLYWFEIVTSKVRPLFTAAGISKLRGYGYAALGSHYTRQYPFIASDVSADPEWDSRKFLAVMDTSAVLKPYLDTLIGAIRPAASEVQTQVLARLALVPNLQAYSADVTIYAGGLIKVDVVIRPYATIQSITFSISVSI